MLQAVKSVLVGITEEGKEEPSSALGYGLSFARQAGAHVTVQATSLKLVLSHAFVSRYAAGLVAAENRRLHALAAAAASGPAARRRRRASPARSRTRSSPTPTSSRPSWPRGAFTTFPSWMRSRTPSTSIAA